MPRISEFYGIAIYMYYQDHAPPHFHAIYGDDEAEVLIANGTIRSGTLPRRAAMLVEEWARLHQQELDTNWRSARNGVPLQSIDPLA
jgi:hypothetical protein